MRIIWLAIVAATYSLSGAAQDFDNYKTVLPLGSIPKDFTEVSSAKVVSEISALDKAEKARIQRSKQKFVLESTYSVDDFLLSGDVLFNDEVSVYLQRVLDEVLSSDASLRGKIRIYAVKSSSVNAFTVSNGIIFVNMGLLARLENEAQLAFVLAHEIVHYQKQHGINAYVTNVEIDRAKGDYRGLSGSEKGFAKSTFSKEQEFEADLDGAAIYLKSDYTKEGMQNVFDILKSADIPLIWQEFNKKRFESERYIFPDSLTAYKPSTIFMVEEDYNDSKSTHPNIKKRKEAVVKKFGFQTGGELYKVSEQSFNTIQKIAKFELCRSLLLERRFFEAFGLAVNLQRENPSSTYLKETEAKALYGIAMYKLRDERVVTAKPLPNAPASFTAFVKNQSAYEISVLAIRQLFICREKNPSNEEIGMMLNHLLQDFGKEFPKAGNQFLRSPEQQEIENVEYPYTQYAFLGFKDVPAFFKLFDTSIAAPKKREWEPTAKRKKKSRVRSNPINPTKIVVVNPNYKVVDIRRKKHKKVQHIEAERVLVNINDKINDAASALSIKVDIINPNKLTAAQVSMMQSNSILNDWIYEKLHNLDDSLVSPIYNEVLEVAEKHKTDHFIWLGGGTVKTKVHGKVLGLLGVIIVPAAVPYLAYNWSTPKGKTLYYSLGFNLRTQQLELVDLRSEDLRDNKWLLQSNIYNTLYKLKY